jgi:hypothetical protein
MVTLAQAKRLRPGQTLYHKKHVNADGSAQRWRVSGQPKTWKRDKSRVRVPVMHGLYSHDYLDEGNLKVLQLKEPRMRASRRKRR